MAEIEQIFYILLKKYLLKHIYYFLLQNHYHKYFLTLVLLLVRLEIFSFNLEDFSECGQCIFANKKLMLMDQENKHTKTFLTMNTPHYLNGSICNAQF